MTARWHDRINPALFVRLGVGVIFLLEVPLLLQKGFWAMEADARTDYAMFMGLLFLLLSDRSSWPSHLRQVSASKVSTANRS